MRFLFQVTYSDFMAMMMDRAIMCEESVVKEASALLFSGKEKIPKFPECISASSREVACLIASWYIVCKGSAFSTETETAAWTSRSSALSSRKMLAIWYHTTCETALV